MTGAEFCDILRIELSAPSDAQLARQLGVSQPAVSTLRRSKSLGSRQIANFIRRVGECKTSGLLEGAIRPIVEYFPIDPVQVRKRGRWYPFDARDHKDLAATTKSSNGIYSFYNSEGKLIYLGKTENNLFDEMIQTYNRRFTAYHLYMVRHPREKYKPDPDGRLRKVSRIPVTLADTASFFSCYEVSPELIVPLEAFVIRLAANNVINSRMETSLKSVGVPATPPLQGSARRKG